MNVWEEGDTYHAELEVPGMKLNELEITVKGNELTIKGERQEKEESEDVTFLRYERHSRAINGTIRLPAEINIEKVEARLEDGILKVRLPKAEKAKARSVQIQAN
jgi:HSP20 family protein